MALIVQKSQITTSDGPVKPNLCHTCGERKPGLFTHDVYGKPQCADCARASGKPID